MSDRKKALMLARNIVDGVNYMLSVEELKLFANEFIRKTDAIQELASSLAAMHDPMKDMIEANRDTILEKHQEAISLIGEVLRSPTEHKQDMLKISLILNALSTFHPMHGESWKGWPE